MKERVSKHNLSRYLGIFAKPLTNKLYCVDEPGIGGKRAEHESGKSQHVGRLAGEVSKYLEHWEKTAEVIVVGGNELSP